MLWCVFFIAYDNTVFDPPVVLLIFPYTFRDMLIPYTLSEPNTLKNAVADPVRGLVEKGGVYKKRPGMKTAIQIKDGELSRPGG